MLSAQDKFDPNFPTASSTVTFHDLSQRFVTSSLPAAAAPSDENAKIKTTLIANSHVTYSIGSHDRSPPMAGLTQTVCGVRKALEAEDKSKITGVTKQAKTCEVTLFRVKSQTKRFISVTWHVTS